jgi:hypothetical protein
MRRLLGLPTSPFQELIGAYLADESLPERVRGWLKFLLHPLRPRNALGARTIYPILARPSPRRSVYASAVQAYWANADWATPADTLLTLDPTNGGPGNLRETITLWRWLVRNN